MEPVGETARMLGRERGRPPTRRFLVVSSEPRADLVGLVGAEAVVTGVVGPFIRLCSLRFVE